MNGQRQNIQYSLVLEPKGRGETPAGGYPRAEPFVAKPAPESPAVMEQLMGGGDRMSDHRIQISGGPDGRRCATERTSKVRGNAFEGTRAVLAWMG
jgi:hypothetical protein